MRGEVRAPREAGGRGAAVAQAACTGGRPDSGLVGARARAERTANMWCMFVTLEVSKLSGWLKTHVDCRESKGGHAMPGGVREGVGWWRRKRHARARTQRKAWGPGHARSARKTCRPCS